MTAPYKEQENPRERMAKPAWGDLGNTPEETLKDVWEDEGYCHTERVD